MLEAPVSCHTSASSPASIAFRKKLFDQHELLSSETLCGHFFLFRQVTELKVLRPHLLNEVMGINDKSTHRSGGRYTIVFASLITSAKSKHLFASACSKAWGRAGSLIQNQKNQQEMNDGYTPERSQLRTEPRRDLLRETKETTPSNITNEIITHPTPDIIQGGRAGTNFPGWTLDLFTKMAYGKNDWSMTPSWEYSPFPDLPYRQMVTTHRSGGRYTIVFASLITSSKEQAPFCECLLKGMGSSR